MNYAKNLKGSSIYPIENIDDTEPFFTVMSSEEFRKTQNQFPHNKELLRCLSSIRYCKAEVFKDCIIGTLRIPQKGEQRLPQLSFEFYLSEKSLLFIENVGDLKSWAEKQLNVIQDFRDSIHLFLQFMEKLIEDDVLYLSKIESDVENMYESLNDEISDDFFLSLTRYRQKLSELNAYYDQLSDMGELIQSCSFVYDTQEWEKYTHRAERLQNHVQLLRENMIQLRELYQSKQDERQNKIMGILTIVTTFFLPLTLITGWYGMNFTYMPELKWRYGYIVIIIVAFIIAIAEIIYFKKKKFF